MYLVARLQLNLEFSWRNTFFLNSILSCYLVPHTFAAPLMYLIVYKMKHFVLYIVNLLHSIF